MWQKPLSNLCPYANIRRNRISPGFSVSTPHATCDTQNVVYCISCSRCPNVKYIGETGTKFRLRFNNHRNSIKHKSSLPVAVHFNSNNHSLHDLQFCIIGTNFTDREARKLAEMKLIIQTGSFKTGLNKDLGWLSNFTFYKK